jgi:hypothetical protein
MTITLANPPSSPRAAVWRVLKIRPCCCAEGWLDL